jgi:hypothetical protein
MLAASGRGGQTLSMLPNLARERVSFDAALLHPLRFREAMSALHDVVISDLRYKPRDKTAYESYRAEQTERSDKVTGDPLRRLDEYVRHLQAKLGSAGRLIHPAGDGYRLGAAEEMA